MSRNISFTIVIAAFNAADTLGTVLSDIKRLYPSIPVIMVDDGSQDNTAEVGRGGGAQVLQHPVNQGSGAAFKSGLEAALESDTSIIVTIGADNQRDPADILKLVERLASDPELAVVIGSKFSMANSIPYSRRLGGKLFSWVFRRLFPRGGHLTDVVSGFRAIRREFVPMFLIAPDGYTFEAACCCIAVLKNLKLAEVPVSVYYHHQSTRMRFPALEGFRILRAMIRYFILRL